MPRASSPTLGVRFGGSELMTMRTLAEHHLHADRIEVTR
jgi:hypothetical protein